MSNLGPEARSLLRAGKDALRPTDDDRARVAEALRARIAAAGAGAPNAAAASAAKAGVWGWSALSALIAGLGAGTLLVAGAFRTEQVTGPALVPPPAASAARPAPGASSERVTSVEGRPTAETPPPQATAGVGVSSARARREPSEQLAEEVEILSRAQRELHAGRFASALHTLEEHARKFARGTLAQERRAARIQALCGLGRVKEADAELARLSPGSVHEGSAREACATKRK